MKKVGIIIFAVALVLGLIASNLFSFGRLGQRFGSFGIKIGSVQGSGKLASEIRSDKVFKAIEVGGAFQVEITAGRDFDVEVQADDNLLSHIRTEVRGETLHIETDRKINSVNPIRVRISAPDIEDLDVSGVANVSMDGVKNEAIRVDASGASKITLKGETSHLTVDISGATKVLGEDLKAVKADVDASGASFVSVNVSDELRSDVSGASKVEYSGTPANVFTNKSGAGRVSPK